MMFFLIINLYLLNGIATKCDAFAPSIPVFSQYSTELKKQSFALQADNFFRAVECAENTNLCKIDELEKLATELETIVGCKFEEDSSQELCDKEIQDRKDVAEILRLQIELKLRSEFLKKDNLFAVDVKKERDVEERKKFKEALLANRENLDAGSDLGLW